MGHTRLSEEISRRDATFIPVRLTFCFLNSEASDPSA